MDTQTSQKKTAENEKEYEVIQIEKTKRACGLCEKYSLSKMEENDLTAVISCEGACLRGEVSRRVANKLCFEELPENTARICLGLAFTKDTGQRNMVNSAKRVVILEGCFIECASRMMKAVIPDLKPEVIHVDRHYRLNKNVFGINEVSEDEIIKYSNEATDGIKEILKK